jgi:uncharacterized membrane protein
MSLAPLLSASPVIQIHALAAMGAFVLGLMQFAAPKGTLPYRTIGWVWVLLMVGVSVSAFFIHEIRLWGPWSPIHLLAIFTLAMLPLAVLHARRHRVAQHRNRMIGIFLGVLIRRSHVPARAHHARGRGRQLISPAAPRGRRRARTAPQALRAARRAGARARRCR